jgi:lipopolysaccharide/colanic/teichoic acid biosynthesis glycosyltransferase
MEPSVYGLLIFVLPIIIIINVIIIIIISVALDKGNEVVYREALHVCHCWQYRDMRRCHDAHSGP